MLEIERKFLWKQPPSLTDGEIIEMIQGYLLCSPVLRIRKENENCVFTYKGEGLRSRREVNLPITEDCFRELLPFVTGTLIVKTRRRIPLGKYVLETDYFHGALEGLCISEVEFPDEAEADAFIFPFPDAVEVTEEGTFHNSALSRTDPVTVFESVSRIFETRKHHE